MEDTGRSEGRAGEEGALQGRGVESEREEEEEETVDHQDGGQLSTGTQLQQEEERIGVLHSLLHIFLQQERDEEAEQPDSRHQQPQKTTGRAAVDS